MPETLIATLGDLARLRRVELAPTWADGASPLTLGGGGGDLMQICEALGWPAPTAREAASLRAHEFPLLVHHARLGWAIAHHLEGPTQLAVRTAQGQASWTLGGECALYDVTIPIPAAAGEHANAWSVFRGAVYRRRGHLYVAAVATLVINILALATSLYSMQVYDRVVPRGAFSTLWVLSFGTLAAFGFDYILRNARARLMEEEAVHIDTEVSEFFFSRAGAVRLDARPPSIGTMAAQLRGMEQIRSMISSSTLFLLTDLPFALFFICIIALIGGPIALVSLVTFPVSLALALAVGRMIRSDTQSAQVSGNKKNGLLVETLDAAETIKANRGQWLMLSRWNRLLEELHASELPVKNLQAASGTLFGTIQQIAYIATIAWGAVEVVNHNMTMGGLIACSILSGRINGPLIGQLPNLVVQWSYSRASLEMLDTIMRLPVERPQNREVLRPSRLEGALAIKDLAFSYPGARVGITVPALSIAAGERVGIIGGIGSGKSTLLRLMAGLYAPQQGAILMDRLDMSHIAEDTLRANIGYLPQDYRLINGTLRDNLTLGIADPGDDTLMAAAERTGLARLISAHPRGVDLPISEGGRGLSGGQRVLTGLTRLLLTQPRLWLLDEPTANLDVDTEVQVLSALQRHIDPKATLLLVTHKLQLLGLVERVIVVANGQIALDGPRDQVLAKLKANQSQAPTAGPTAGAPAPAAQPGAATRRGAAKHSNPFATATVPVGGKK
jgi:ATP-binding cassette subfamily C protein LapB